MMRYCALVIFIILLIALVVKKFNKEYTYLECLLITQLFLGIIGVIFLIGFIFIKYW